MSGPAVRWRQSPAPALGALGITIFAACAATGSLSIDAVEVPAIVAAIIAAFGLSVARARWESGRASPTPVNLALCVAAALFLTLTQATINADDPPGGLHAMAEVFIVVLTLRSFALTDVNRLRSGLLISMGAVLTAAANADVGSALPWLALWLVGAVVCLVATGEVASSELPMLAGSRAPVHPSWGRRGRDAIVVMAIVLFAAMAVVVFDPDPGRSAPRFGREPTSRKSAPYVRFDSQLDTGARFELSDEVVMRVRAAAPDYWRGQSFDRWDGRVWRRSAESNSSFTVGRDGFVPAGIGDPEGGGQALVQRIRVEAPYMQAMFGAYRIDEIESPVRGMIVHGDGSIELRSPIGPGTEYTVISLRQPVTESLLRTANPVTERLPAYISNLYLQLPPTVPARVTELAHALTDSEPTAYDKVQAIEKWLGDNTEYTLDIPRLPDGADAVEQHLFVDKRGFCEQIATSTAVLLRSVGVPARVTVGFVPGERSLLGDEFTVRAKDAHAWVEVWFPGIGWQAFDPTADVPLAGESTSTAARRLLDLLSALAPLFAALAIAVALGIAAWLAWTAVSTRRAAARRPWAERYLTRLETAGAARGRPRAPPETPAEYASALAESVLPDRRLVGAGAVLTRATYGSAEPDGAEQRNAEAVLEEIEAAYPVSSRWRASRRAPRRS